MGVHSVQWHNLYAFLFFFLVSLITLNTSSKETEGKREKEENRTERNPLFAPVEYLE